LPLRNSKRLRSNSESNTVSTFVKINEFQWSV
jgi:hypothetical protein